MSPVGQGLPSSEAQELGPPETEGSSPEDGEPLPNVAPTAHPVVEVPESVPHVWDLINRHILVRSEYVEAVQAAISANEKA